MGTGQLVAENNDQRSIRFTLEPVRTDKYGKKVVPVTGEEFVTQPIEAAMIPSVSGAYRPTFINPKDYAYLKDFNDWTEKYPTPGRISEKANINILLMSTSSTIDKLNIQRKINKEQHQLRYILNWFLPYWHPSGLWKTQIYTTLL